MTTNQIKTFYDGTYNETLNLKIIPNRGTSQVHTAPKCQPVSTVMQILEKIVNLSFPEQTNQRLNGHTFLFTLLIEPSKDT